MGQKSYLSSGKGRIACIPFLQIYSASRRARLSTREQDICANAHAARTHYLNILANLGCTRRIEINALWFGIFGNLQSVCSLLVLNKGI
jgi:hypothetical protein